MGTTIRVLDDESPIFVDEGSSCMGLYEILIAIDRKNSDVPRKIRKKKAKKKKVKKKKVKAKKIKKKTEIYLHCDVDEGASYMGLYEILIKAEEDLKKEEAKILIKAEGDLNKEEAKVLIKAEEDLKKGEA